MANKDVQRTLVSAIVLAAGQSRRMGSPKLVLPWGSRTVIEQVIQTLIEAGIIEIVVVTGGDSGTVEGVLKNKYPIKLVRNPQYARSEMLGSLKVGMRALSTECRALLVVLGDQPMIQTDVVQKVVETYIQTGAVLVVPSYQMRRGHPWLVDRSLWAEILGLSASQTMRDFMQAHANWIAYSQMDAPEITTDIDTPEDYENLRPRG